MSSLAHVAFEGASDKTRSTIQKAFSKNNVHTSPTVVELDSMPIGVDAHYTGPISKPADVVTHDTVKGFERAGLTYGETNSPISHKPLSPNELELSRPPSPQLDESTAVVQTWNSPWMNRWRLLSACLICFGNGCNDSAPGALIPYVEQNYNVGYAVVSLIFVSNAIGFILAAFFIHALDSRLGRAKTLMLCDLVLVLASVVLAIAPPFPVFVVCFFVVGLAQATNLALNNVFVANLANSSVLLGWFHGSYGIGGIIAPILATALVTHGVLFARFYFVMVGIRLISLVFGGWAFWSFERDASSSSTLLTELERTASRQAAADATNEPTKVQQLKIALKQRTTLVGALFIFAYQGAEVSNSGWVISFLINYRDGDPSKVGYATVGFWGGITVGRFLLGHAASRIGEKAFVFGLIAGAIAFQVIVWFVPNVIGDSVAIALIGLLTGPIYPCATVVFARVLPRNLQNTALAFVASAGSSGGAIAPFATGLLAQASGTWVLHPICVGLFALMLACWFLLPTWRKRQE